MDLDRIVLMTGAVEQGPLSGELLRHAPRLTIIPVMTADDLIALDPGELASARLIAFCSGIVVPKRVLDALAFGAYNFHPGSPNYPGWAPAPFAVYDGARQFGATAHRMSETVDAGPIVDVELFDVPPGTGVRHLAELAFAAAARLFWRLAPTLATRAAPLDALPITWSGQRRTRRAFAEMCRLSFGMDAGEIARRLDAFGTGDGISRPVLTFHDYTFRLDERC